MWQKPFQNSTIVILGCVGNGRSSSQTEAFIFTFIQSHVLVRTMEISILKTLILWKIFKLKIMIGTWGIPLLIFSNIFNWNIQRKWKWMLQYLTLNSESLSNYYKLVTLGAASLEFLSPSVQFYAFGIFSLLKKTKWIFFSCWPIQLLCQLGISDDFGRFPEHWLISGHFFGTQNDKFLLQTLH